MIAGQNQITPNIGKGNWWGYLGVQIGGKPNIKATLKLPKSVFARMP